MPELPDVEYFKRYIDATALHHPIEHVTVTRRAPLADCSADTLRKHLHGRRFERSRRHGKQLGIRLDTAEWLMVHFGMTGEPVYQNVKADMPEYTGLYTVFNNDHAFAYVCRRKLGKLQLAEDFDDFIEQQKLGIDALDEKLSGQVFRDLLRGHRGAVKALLMNQGVLAGVGNVYADETLYQAGIHPATNVDQLDNDRINHLYRTLRRVLRTAADRQVDPDRFPDGWLLPHRGDRQCPKGHGKLSKEKINGRSSYVCPRCQPRA